MVYRKKYGILHDLIRNAAYLNLRNINKVSIYDVPKDLPKENVNIGFTYGTYWGDIKI